MMAVVYLTAVRRLPPQQKRGPEARAQFTKDKEELQLKSVLKRNHFVI